MKTGALALHRYTIRFALASSIVFAWVFVFQYFYVRTESLSSALGGAALTYALSQIVIALLTPWTASRIRHGLKRSMVFGVLALAAAYTSLGVAFSGDLGDIGIGIALFALFLGTYRALYYVPYATAFASRGAVHLEALIALAPLFGGLVLVYVHAPSILLFAAALFALASILPLFFISDAYEKYSWSYRESFHELFATLHRKLALRALLDGAESAALFLVWPIVVFLLVGWSYAVLGLVLAATQLVLIAAKALFGSALDRATPLVRASLTASAWAMRMVIANPLSIVLVDIYHRSGGRLGESALHEQAADNETYLDEYTALKEMSLALGRLLFALTVGAAAFVFSFSPIIVGVFAAAAVLSALSFTLVARKAAPPQLG